MLNLRKWIGLFIFFMMFFCSGVSLASEGDVDASVTSYQLQSIFDSGGGAASTVTSNLIFQSVSPIFSSVLSKDSLQLINGVHFDSTVGAIEGFDPFYERADVTLNAQTFGLMSSKIEFELIVDGTIYSFISDTDHQFDDTGWTAIWDSLEHLSDTESYVSVNARVFDGLTWGPWYRSPDKIFIDNLYPVIANVVLNTDKFSPSNETSVGILDTITAYFDIEENFFNSYSINILDSEDNIVQSFSTLSDFETMDLYQFDQLWDGKNTAGDYQSDGLYRFQIQAEDLAGNVASHNLLFVLDDTAPDISNMLLFTEGQALNSQLGKLDLSWIVEDNFDQFVSQNISYQYIDFNVNSLSGLVLWLDAADAYSISEVGDSKVQVLEDKSRSGNHFIQSRYSFLPSLVRDESMSFDVLEFDQYDDSLSSINTFLSGSIYYLYSVVFREGNWQISMNSFTLSSSQHLHLGISEELANNANKIAEIIIVTEPLSIQEQASLFSYLSFKWNLSISDSWIVDTENTFDNEWEKEDLPDSAYYRMKVVGTDDVGNSVVTYSNVAFTPDRTAPVISSDFVEINATEDVVLVYDPFDYELDNYSSHLGLVWNASIVMEEDDPINSSEEVLEYISLASDGQSLEIIPVQDRNTASTDGGNMYGLDHDARINVELFDQQGNYAVSTVQLNIEPVNDPPVFIDHVGTNVLYDSFNDVIYNVKVDEDTVSDPFYLREYVIDIDNDIEDLVFGVSNPDYNLLLESDKRLYQSVSLNVEFSDEFNDTAIIFTPSLNFYGDQSVSINVQDADGLYTDQEIIVRVWPVNDPPVISDLMRGIEVSDEDNNIVLTLTDYENDVFLEDQAPTYNHLLNWTIESLTDEVTLDTSLSASDTFTFIPEENFYGTVNFVVKLTDSDIVAEGVFPPDTEYGGYHAQPLSVTSSFSVVWNPVNDPPTPLDIPPQIKEEDFGVWTLDLSSYKTDIEDDVNDLDWSVQLDTDFVTYTYDDATNVITFQTVQDGYGKLSVGLTLTDKDNNIDFQPYVPNPASVQHYFDLEVSPVNDVPSLEGVVVSSVVTDIADLVLTDDVLKAQAIGYKDIGVENGVFISELGTEYNQTLNGEDFGGVEYESNTVLYDYYWYVDGELIQTEVASVSSSNLFTVNSDYQGKNITVEVLPNDSNSVGLAKTKGLLVNTLPDNIDTSSEFFAPELNFYTNTGNVRLAWDSVTDFENDDIVYRLGIWKTDKFVTVPMEEMTLDSVKFYDSGWFLGEDKPNFEEIISGLTHGSYFWRVWTGNLFNEEFYDTDDPGWFNMFTVDFIPPSFNIVSEYLAVSDILENAVIEDAGNTRILFGDKPSDADDMYYYRIVLNSENTIYDDTLNEVEVVTDSIVIVDYTNEDQWQFELTYPFGDTIYHIMLEDLANNITTLNSFTITEDRTPPYGFEIFGEMLSSYQARVSSNHILLEGTKEAEAAIFYSGNVVVNGEVQNNVSQIVGYTDSTTFTLPLFYTKPKGYLFTVDRNGNVAAQTTLIDIEFVYGSPNVFLSPLNRSNFGVIENVDQLVSYGYPEEFVMSFSEVAFDLSSDRFISNYELYNSNDELLDSGTNVPAGVTENIVFPVSLETFVEGSNEIKLVVYDDLNNSYENTFDVNVVTHAPETDVVTLASMENIQFGTTSVWQLQIYGVVDDGISVFVNNQPVEVNSSGYWFYLDFNFSPDDTNINILLVDDMYNSSLVSLWDYSYFSNYSTYADISLPISEINQDEANSLLTYAYLPESIRDLFIEEYYPDTVGPYGYYVLKSSQGAPLDLSDITIANSDISIPASLSKKVFKIYAKNKMGEEVDTLDLDPDYQVKAKFLYPESYDYDVEDLVVLKLDEEQQSWFEVLYEPTIDFKNNIIYTTIDSTGIYALAELNASQDTMDSFRVYPNPWVPNDVSQLTGDSVGVTFDRLMDNTTIKIYTLSGELVIDTIVDSSWVWDGTNAFGQDVFSGVYLYVVQSASDKASGKLTIVR